MGSAILHESAEGRMAITRFQRGRVANALTATCLIFAKSLRIYSQWDALPQLELLLWWPFLIAQDTGILLVLRHLAEIAPTLTYAFSAIILVLASVSGSFYLYTAAELQWKDYKLASNPAYWRMMLSGSTTLAMTVVALFVLAYALQSICCTYTEIAYSTVIRKRVSFFQYRAKDEEDVDQYPDYEPKSSKLYHRIVRIILAWQLACTILQHGTTLSTNLSLSLPLLVLTHLLGAKSTLLAPSKYKTALTTPLPFSWLPEHPQAGFLDWYTSEEHYNAGHDILRASSHHLDLLPALRQTDLKQLSIRHVLLLKLEATRKDVFPIDPNGSTVNKLASTFEHNRIPPNIRERVSSLTNFAEYLTTGSDDAQKWPPRGRLHAQQAFTASTYTLKSITGTICGIAPIAADFNMEHSHHIYQPCLPHILSVLNNLDVASRPWESKFMQSTTMQYDDQDKLLSRFGFQDIIGAEYLREQHKFAPVNFEDVNYFGMPEEALEDYIRDAFITAREGNSSLFLSHLTSTTHHGFGIPKTADSTPLAGSPKGSLLSDYLNAIGYVDNWLGKITTILQEEGALNETLIIAVGDHGLALAEHDHITTYRDPHVATLHVPLIISLPGLPNINININNTVTSLQILPTILDLLIETNSLSPTQTKAAFDLLHNSEGYSLLRNPPKDDNSHWTFHITNPGGSSLTLRDSRRPNWRLAVPRVSDEPWRFVDLGHDPWEMKPIRAMSSQALITRVGLYNVTLPMEWLVEAEEVMEWWVQENYRRWRYMV